MGQLKKFLAILLFGWIAARFTVQPVSANSGFGSEVLTLIEALAFAFVPALVVWLFTWNGKTQFGVMLTVPNFIVVLVIGILGSGGAYGSLRDSGLEPDAAALASVLGWPGVLIAIGVVGAVLVRKKEKSTRNEDAQGPANAPNH
jgi:hypothetical protein